MNALHAYNFSPTRMPANSRVAAAVSVFAFGALVGCSGGSTPLAQRSEVVSTKIMSTANGDLALSPSNGVPLAVTQVGTFAEDGYDAVRTAKWSAAAVFADSLRRAMPGLPSAPAAQTVLTEEVRSTVAALKGALDTRDRTRGMRATNRITYLAAQLGASYHAQTPVEVLLMDYYGRELEIGAVSHDSAAVRRTARDISEKWRTLRPVVEAHGGAVEAARFNALVTQVLAANSPAQSGQLATPFLNEVDKLELVFTKK